MAQSPKDVPDTLDEVELTAEEQALFNEDFLDRVITAAVKNVKRREERRLGEDEEVANLAYAVFGDWLLQEALSGLPEALDVDDAIHEVMRRTYKRYPHAPAVRRVLRYGREHAMSLMEWSHVVRRLSAYAEMVQVSEDSTDDEVRQAIEAIAEDSA